MRIAGIVAWIPSSTPGSDPRGCGRCDLIHQTPGLFEVTYIVGDAGCLSPRVGMV